GELFFSSMRDKENDFRSRIYRTDEKLKNIKMWLGSTEKIHAANGAFNDKVDEMYYSVCDNKKHCVIAYMATRNANTTPQDLSWEKGETITIKNMDNSNDTTFSNTQPHLTKINGTEYLFFASNHPSGKGGYDIYMAKRIDKKTFEKPVNLSDINTSG